MRLLLDTHFLIWIATDQNAIRPAERKILEQTNTEFLVSILSIWEVRIKWNQLDRHGVRKGLISPDTAICVARDSDLLIEELLSADMAIPLDPPLPHKDPFDELLLVHAQRLGARLFTRDDRLRDHPLAMAV